MSRINPKAVCGFIFSVIGGFFLGLGIMFVVLFGSIHDGKVEVDAVIAYIDTYSDEDGTVFVDYYYMGEEYKGIELDSYSSSMREGDERVIYISPKNPTEAIDKQTTSMVRILMGGIFGGIGGIFVIIGIAFIMSVTKKKALARRLKAAGYYIYAHIDCVDITGIRINNHPTFVIKCSCDNPYEGKTYKFKSEHIGFDPTMNIQGDSIKVYVDENDYSKYYVDLTGII